MPLSEKVLLTPNKTRWGPFNSAFYLGAGLNTLFQAGNSGASFRWLVGTALEAGPMDLFLEFNSHMFGERWNLPFLAAGIRFYL